MPKIVVPDGASALWQWMERFKVTVAELAKLLDVTPNYLGDVRRGVYKPSDELKLKIEEHTIRIETERGVKRPRGVVPGDWFLRPVSSSRPRTTTGPRRRVVDS